MKTRGTLGDKDPLNKVPSPRAKVVPLNGVSLIPPRILCTKGWKILMLESLQEINADPNCSTLNPLKTLLPNYEILQPNAITSKLIRTCAPTFALASKPENQKPHLDDHLQGKGFRPVESYEKKTSTCVTVLPLDSRGHVLLKAENKAPGPNSPQGPKRRTCSERTHTQSPPGSAISQAWDEVAAW